MANSAAEARAFAQSKWNGASVHGRGRKWIRHEHPTEPGRFMLDTQIAPMHYGSGEDQEIDTAWVSSSGSFDYEAVDNDFHLFIRDSVPITYRYLDVATGHSVDLVVDGIEWVNDEGQSEPAASFSQVVPTISDDEIKWSGIATGWDVRVLSEPGRLSKWLDIDSLSNLGSPSIGGTNIRLRLSFTIQRSNDLEIWVDGSQWLEANNTWVETSGDIEFRDSQSQQTVFWFKRPHVNDSAGAESVMLQRTRRTGANFYAEVEVPWVWLQAATFPVSIDPTIDPQVAAGNDDASERNDNTSFSSSSTTVDISSDNDSNISYNGGFRFTLTGPASADTIDVAYATLKLAFTFADDPNVNIHFEDVDDADDFSTTADVTDRTPTTASASWVGSGLGTGWVNSSSIVSPLQELINREGWVSGNQAVALFKGKNDFDSGALVVAYDSLSSDAMKLHIEYSSGPACPSVTVQSNTLEFQACDTLDSYALAITHATPTSDVEGYMKFRFNENDAGGTKRFYIRGSGDWSSYTPTKAYEVAIDSAGGYIVNRITTATRTQIGTAGSWTADTNWWWIKFQAEGTQIRFKIWQDGIGEPVAWDKDINDSASGFTDAGVLQLALHTDTAGNTHTSYVDDVEYRAPTSSAGDSQAAYIAGSLDDQDSKEAYIAGQDTAVDNKSAYIQGQDVAVDNKAAYIVGGVNVSDNQAAYIKGQDTASDSKSAFIEGFVAGSVSDNKSAYIAGTDTATDNKSAYIAGGVSASDNQSAYIVGSLDDQDSKEAYIAGQDTAVDSKSAYIFGLSDYELSNIPAYIAGQDTAVDNKSAYIVGGLDDQDSKEAYIAGQDTADDSKEAYIAGQDTAVDSREAYIAGTADAVDSKSAYIAGIGASSASVPAYIAGSASDASSQPAYIAGGIVSVSSISAYMEGIIEGVANATYKGMRRGMYKRMR